MKPIYLSCLFLSWILFALNASAQKVEQDKEAIKQMCGCYKVTFDYAETFASDTAYQKYKPYHAEARAEWIFVTEETDEMVSLQHLLVVKDDRIVKHWRQEWVYENTHLYQFENTRYWNYQQLPEHKVQGQWTQKVYQVDDSPRYEGSASWVHIDGKRFWENTTDAPLPRRDYTKRSDYNVMQRTNRHTFTNYGWLHEQDNLKIIRENGNDSILVAEKGMNRYIRIDDKHCQPAIDWWEENKAYWKLVRSEWNSVFNKHEDIYLAAEVDGKKLYEALFELGKKSAEVAAAQPKEVQKEIAVIIDRYRLDTDEATHSPGLHEASEPAY